MKLIGVNINNKGESVIGPISWTPNDDDWFYDEDYWD